MVSLLGDGAAESATSLKGLAQDDPTLDLRRQDLPVGETATLDAEGKPEEYDLLLSSGADFEVTLLLSQALNYGSHVAKVAADNSADHEEAAALVTISRSLDRLLAQVKAIMRSLPSK
jgi:hypothetical protein